jgi:transcriptional regulator with XRE-family HTH domain
MSNFGTRLKELRIEKNLQQKELAAIVNVHKGTVSNWENNKRFPDKDMLFKIANFFDVTIDYLLCNSDKNNNEIDTLSAGASKITTDNFLTKRDKKDIEKTFQSIIDEIENQEISPDPDSAITFDGEPLDEMDMILFKNSLKNLIEVVKIKNKEKYTPKKY